MLLSFFAKQCEQKCLVEIAQYPSCHQRKLHLTNYSLLVSLQQFYTIILHMPPLHVDYEDHEHF